MNPAEKDIQEKISLKNPPKNVVKADYKDLLNSVELGTSSQNKKLLLMQTMQGHANMAHGMFKTHDNHADCIKYPNCTIDTIAEILSGDKLLGMSQKQVKEARMKNVNDIRDLMHKIINGEKVTKIENEDGETILGLDIFEGYQLKDPKNLLKGFYLGSIMDNYDPWRKEVEKEYGLVMGGGDCVAVNMHRINDKILGRMLAENEDLAMCLGMATIDGFHLGTLANEEWAPNMQILYDYGIVVDKEMVKASKKVVNAYVRRVKGKGVSDNGAVVMAGKIYGQNDKQDGLETAFGVFLADAVDTWDKYLPIIQKGGMDERIGQEIIDSGAITVPREERINFIYLSALRSRKKMPDCSQRYFLQIDNKIGQSAIENHIDYIMGNTPKKMFLGHRAKSVRVKSEDFYGAIEDIIKQNPDKL